MKNNKGKGKKTMETNTQTTNANDPALAGIKASAVLDNLNNTELAEFYYTDLLPEEFIIPEDLSVRLMDGDPATEARLTKELAESILRDGQLQPALAYETIGEGQEVQINMFAGNRRRAAIALNNAELPEGAEPTRVQVKVYRGEYAKEKLIQMAAAENLKRKNYSPLELAKLFAHIRELKGWQAGKHTKDVAKFFGVSGTTVTQHEKYLKFPPELQVQLHERTISGKDALAIYAAAEELAAKEAELSVHSDKPSFAETAAAGTATATAPAPAADGKGKSAGKGKGEVTTEHIARAATSRQAQTEAPVNQAVNRKGLLEPFEQIADSPAYGHANSPVRAFAAYMIEKFAVGKGTANTLLSKFDACIMSEDGDLFAGEGTPSKSEKAALDKEEAAAAAEKTKKKGTGTGKGKKGGGE